jgi:hypothetical protein
LKWVRKNRNDGKHDGYQPCTNDDYFGVDLNRNYGYKFASSDIGSSNDPCDEAYRGPYPFSEPETQAIKKFVEDHNDTLIYAINFHAYGNLFIFPFNFDTVQNHELYQKFPKQAEVYAELANDPHMPVG